MSNKSSSFIDNLGKVYALYTLGFLAFFALMAVLESFGAGARLIGILFLLFTLVIYAGIGWLSRTMEVGAYYVAGREVPPAVSTAWRRRRTGCPVRLVCGAGRRHLFRWSRHIWASSSAGPAVTCW